MSTHYAKLLRRTLFAAGSGLLLAASLPAASQGTVTLSSGASCQYSQMTVQPNGSITVQCTTSSGGGGGDPSATHFTASVAASGAPGSTQQLTVARANTGNIPYVNVNWAYSGACTGTNNNFVLGPGTQWTENFTLGQTGSCTITLTAASPHTVSSATISVSTSTGGGGGGDGGGTGGGTGLPTVPGCPTPSSLASLHDLAFGPVEQLRMKSGHIAVYPVIPQSSASASFYSVKLTQGQQPNTPAAVTTELFVSRCPGVIQNTGNDCYRSSTFTNQNEAIVYTRPTPWGWVDQSSIPPGQGCMGDSSQGPWYVNVRWTYATCTWGENQCGFSMQWAIGPY